MRLHSLRSFRWQVAIFTVVVITVAIGYGTAAFRGQSGGTCGNASCEPGEPGVCLEDCPVGEGEDPNDPYYQWGVAYGKCFGTTPGNYYCGGRDGNYDGDTNDPEDNPPGTCNDGLACSAYDWRPWGHYCRCQCETAAACNDNNPRTTDECVYGGGLTGYSMHCSNTPPEGGCADVSTCDDYNVCTTDACPETAFCTHTPIPGCTRCGNGELNTEDGEECDDGNNMNEDWCSGLCKAERCGDGVVQYSLGEACDDGNTDEGDGCSSGCQQACSPGIPECSTVTPQCSGSLGDVCGQFSDPCCENGLEVRSAVDCCGGYNCLAQPGPGGVTRVCGGCAAGLPSCDISTCSEAGAQCGTSAETCCNAGTVQDPHDPFESTLEYRCCPGSGLSCSNEGSTDPMGTCEVPASSAASSVGSSVASSIASSLASSQTSSQPSSVSSSKSVSSAASSTSSEILYAAYCCTGPGTCRIVLGDQTQGCVQPLQLFAVGWEVENCPLLCPFSSTSSAAFSIFSNTSSTPSSAASSTLSNTSSAASSSTTSAALCGNGVADPGEECGEPGTRGCLFGSTQCTEDCWCAAIATRGSSPRSVSSHSFRPGEPACGPVIEPLPQVADSLKWAKDFVAGADERPFVTCNVHGSIMTIRCADVDCTRWESPPFTQGHEYMTMGADYKPVYTQAFDTGLSVVQCGHELSCAIGAYNTQNLIDANAVIGNAPARQTSTVLDPDGNPVIAYVDSKTQELKIALCHDPACATSTISVLDSVPGLPDIANTSKLNEDGSVPGNFVSIVIGSDGKPVVSYYDPEAGDLRVASCGNPACTSGNTAITVESEGDVGATSVLTIGSDGLPMIAYHDKSNGDVKMLRCADPSCASNESSIIIPDADPGTNLSLTIGKDGNPVLHAYPWEDVAANLTTVTCGDSGCTSGNSMRVTETPHNLVAGQTVGMCSDGTTMIIPVNGWPQKCLTSDCACPQAGGAATSQATQTSVASAASQASATSIVLAGDPGGSSAMNVQQSSSPVALVDATAGGGSSVPSAGGPGASSIAAPFLASDDSDGTSSQLQVISDTLVAMLAGDDSTQISADVLAQLDALINAGTLESVLQSIIDMSDVQTTVDAVLADLADGTADNPETIAILVLLQDSSILETVALEQATGLSAQEMADDLAQQLIQSGASDGSSDPTIDGLITAATVADVIQSAIDIGNVQTTVQEVVSDLADGNADEPETNSVLNTLQNPSIIRAIGVQQATGVSVQEMSDVIVRALLTTQDGSRSVLSAQEIGAVVNAATVWDVMEYAIDLGGVQTTAYEALFDLSDGRADATATKHVIEVLRRPDVQQMLRNDQRFVAGALGRTSAQTIAVSASILCGDGMLSAVEECDDGNRRDRDGCSSDCFFEQGICGDGRVQRALDETCEPILHDATLPFSCNPATCRFLSLSCGNGTMEAGEECDDGRDNNRSIPGASCRPDCSYSRCGDRIIDPTESCDDGNRLNSDGCSALCQSERGAPSAIAYQSPPPAWIAPSQPWAMLQPLATSRPPVGDTGPAAVAVIAAGAASGMAWMRRKRR